MIEFENKYFKEFKFSKKQIDRFIYSATKDLEIAKDSNVPEVQFQFAYNSFIKLGIALVACYGYKVSSRTGHHVKILEKMSEILENKDILIHGNKMRKIRNTELYDGGIIITNKQAGEYFSFVQEIYKTVQRFLKDHFKSLF
jgi:phage pi2 protein 07